MPFLWRACLPFGMERAEDEPDGAEQDGNGPPIGRPEDDRGTDHHCGKVGVYENGPDKCCSSPLLTARRIESPRNVRSPDNDRGVIEPHASSPVDPDHGFRLLGRVSHCGGVAPAMHELKRRDHMQDEQHPATCPTPLPHSFRPADVSQIPPQIAGSAETSRPENERVNRHVTIREFATMFEITSVILPGERSVGPSPPRGLNDLSATGRWRRVSGLDDHASSDATRAGEAVPLKPEARAVGIARGYPRPTNPRPEPSVPSPSASIHSCIAQYHMPDRQFLYVTRACHVLDECKSRCSRPFELVDRNLGGWVGDGAIPTARASG